ncbi:cilia- and flagella-associated protein 157 [Toxorhynchites rutilus septentrionalis]|uniref:cilia- and flagella-associated protein 157 n=1 Tax=Toxorhynchites rutilus septentrionalis TaxID=329112 RepID=UPI002478BDE6|nr:cilia- and flagella-associated protein 157 [Toxorhynchites rutilus septentrionalis]
MPKEKKAKKAKKAVPEYQPVDGLNAVDRQFFEITINDLNQKLARLRTHNVKIEERNEELENKLKQIEEDRADVTAFLDRTLKEKLAVIIELEDKLSELSKVRDQENEECQKQIVSLDAKYRAMHEQLTSEIKLLTGKLNSMEEFRIQRDELMAKFDAQDTELKEQNKRHKTTLYEMERKVILDKDRLRKDVENKLLQLSTEFTKSSEIRVAAHTQRLVRENIALNNEMDRMIFTQERLEKQYAELKTQNTELRNQAEIDLVEKQRLMQTCQERLDLIKQLADQYEQQLHTNAQLFCYKEKANEFETETQSAKKEYNHLRQKVRILEQYVHYINTDRQALRNESDHHRSEFDRISEILKTVRLTVQSAFKEDDEEDDLPYQEIKRKRLIDDLLNALNDLELKPRIDISVATLPDATEGYEQGDLGVIPRETLDMIIQKTQTYNIAETPLISSDSGSSMGGKGSVSLRVGSESDVIIDVVSGSQLVFKGSEESYDDEDEAKSAEGESETVIDGEEKSRKRSVADEEQQDRSAEEEGSAHASEGRSSASERPEDIIIDAPEVFEEEPIEFGVVKSDSD